MYAFTLCFKGVKNNLLGLTLDSNIAALCIYHGLIAGTSLNYEDGRLVFRGKKIKLYAENGEDVWYEINLDSLKKNEMRLRIGQSFLKECNDGLKDILSEDRYVDLKAFVAYYAGKSKGDLLYRYTTDWKSEKYNVAFEMYKRGNMLYIKRFQEENPDYVKRDDTRRDPKKSRLEDVIINNQISFNMDKTNFVEVMKEIYENGYTFEMRIEEYMIPGHAITIPCLEVRAKDFMIVFEDNHVLEVHFGESIMDNSYYTNTRGEEMNVGELVRKYEQKNRHVKIDGYGADNVWHYVLDGSLQYIYAFGYCP